MAGAVVFAFALFFFVDMWVGANNAVRDISNGGIFTDECSTSILDASWVAALGIPVITNE